MIKSIWDPSLCFEVVGGGSLSPCDPSSHGQQWTVKPVVRSDTQPGTDSEGEWPKGAGSNRGAQQLQQLVSGTGFGCLSNGPPQGGPPTELTFDVSGLGWDAATSTDLWSGALFLVWKVCVYFSVES